MFLGVEMVYGRGCLFTGDGRGNGMSCREFCFIREFVNDLGRDDWVNYFFDEREDGGDDEGPGTTNNFGLVPRLA